MTEVAIVGVGIYPFGRHKDVTALEMGAAAARAALADAGMRWSDIPYAVGGSLEVDIPDAMVAYLGLTGIDLTNVYNGCATAGTALSLGVQAIRSGRHDRVLVVGLDGQLKVEGRLYDVDPEELRFGMEFEVVVRPFRTTGDGTEVYTFGFAPSRLAGG